jgi:hypothetical protein
MLAVQHLLLLLMLLRPWGTTNNLQAKQTEPADITHTVAINDNISKSPATANDERQIILLPRRTVASSNNSTRHATTAAIEVSAVATILITEDAEARVVNAAVANIRLEIHRPVRRHPRHHWKILTLRVPMLDLTRRS